MCLKKIFYIFLVLITSLLLLFFTAGYYLDTTQKAVKSDILVCLGGGEKLERIKASLSLYKKGYIEQKLILITGGTSFTQQDPMRDDRVHYVTSQDKNIKVLYKPLLRNTAEELLDLKAYMLENGFEQAIIVSDPPCSRRIRMFLNIFEFQKEGLEVVVVGTEAKWWDKWNYYKSAIALRLVISEMVKVPYAYVKYAVLEKLGLLEAVERLEDRLDVRSKFYQLMRENIK